MSGRDYPIIMSTPMVRAALDGRKTMTRRLAFPVTWQKVKPGDRLYVRENICIDYFGLGQHAYRADWTPLSADVVPEPKWRPSIHMPRACSRVTLLITATRIENLHAITEADCIREGIHHARPPSPSNFWTDDVSTISSTPRAAFAGLWEHLHGHGAWMQNPPVVVLSFAVRAGNIDALPKEAA
jgi:hypothetical protein